MTITMAALVLVFFINSITDFLGIGGLNLRSTRSASLEDFDQTEEEISVKSMELLPYF